MPLTPVRQFLISPPAGSWFSALNAYSVLGSITVQPRPGRLGQILRTVRPQPFEGGPAWSNKIGLRNPGLESLRDPGYRHLETGGPLRGNEILSLAPLVPADWTKFQDWLDRWMGNVLVEFNVSCPNVDGHPDIPPPRQLKRILTVVPDSIWKLPPYRTSVDVAIRLYDAGVKTVHLSNTWMTPIGGISGAPLREINLPLVEELANSLPSLEIIGGGGIYTPDDAAQYRSAGATRISVATAFFKPWRGKRLLRGF